MKIRLLAATTLLPLLFSCAQSLPEIPMTEVPADPLVRELEYRRGSFAGLRAAARVQTERKGRKRVYESVAILLQGQSKFRIEGYGPVGEPVFDALWDGKDMMVRMPGEADLVKRGPWAFERLIGFPLMPMELAAVLSGNVPPTRKGAESRAGCMADGRCLVDLRTDDGILRVRFEPTAPFRVESVERFRGSDLLYAARFHVLEPVNGYLFPKRITVVGADRSAELTIEYQDMEVNVPVADSAFLVSGEGAGR